MNNKLVFLCVILLIISILMNISFNILNKMGQVDSIKNKNINYNEKIDKELIDFKANQTILVRMSKDNNEVVAMDFNDYLRGVLASEMPASYDIEALKAQAVVARTYTYKKIEDNAELNEAHICDDFNHCQAFHTKDEIMKIWEGRGFSKELREEYWSKINEAVYTTQDLVITYDNNLIKAFFHASSPVKTESVDQIWGKISYPYLKSVENVESDEYVNRYSSVSINFNDIEKYIRENINSNYILDYTGDNINIIDYTTSLRVNEVNFAGVAISAEKLRVAFGLKSTNFDLRVENGMVIFNVIGYGHGVGLSQVGSDYLASNNIGFEDIIKYYYTGVDIVKISSF